jgi:DNA (cytosine-5)-methyltransferase 1
MNDIPTPTIGSLFSGYGGLDMAVESVTGARTAWVSDIDKGACKILAHRYPDVPNLGDLTAIDWAAVEPVDIITGGFPCQDLSHAGKRAGMADGTRSGLWSYMCDAINIIRPRLVVAENVRGLLSAEALRSVEPCTWCVGDDANLDLRALGAVLADLADIGYVGGWHGLFAGRPTPIDDLTHVGASHGRFRVFLAAHPAGRRLHGWTRQSVGRTFIGTSAAGARANLLPTPRSSDANGPGAHGDGGLDLRTAVTLLPTPVVTDAAGARNATANRSDPDSKHHSGTTLSDALRLLPTPRAGDGEKGGPNQRGSSGDFMLPSAVTHLLPTPMVGSTSPAAKSPKRASAASIASRN